MSKLKPRQGREMCLKFLFATEFKKFEQESKNEDEVIHPELLVQLRAFKTAFKASDEVWDFVKKIIVVLTENHQHVDEQIESQLQNWKLDRLSYTDKNILRIALCEIFYQELNPKIAINEALELSKLYSSSDAKSFINGILDSIVSEKGLKDD